MKSNKVLVVLIIVLSILVLMLGGYVLYDKVLDKDDSNNSDDIISDDGYETGSVGMSNEEALLIVKNLTKKYFEYKHSLGPYCGDADYNDYVSFGSYETMDFRDYWVSTTYSSISEIREYYESIMTKELLPSYLDDGVSYIEQDGKLYCQLAHKGCGDVYMEDDSTFTITNVNDNSIIAEVILSSDACEQINRREGTIEIIKNENGNWVISKYDVQIS